MLETIETFFVGGRYIKFDDGGTRMADQIYVQLRTPQNQLHPFPIVMIPGGHLTAAVWETTPDGRPGWADIFVDHGYAVCVIDQPARARSAYHPEVHGTVEGHSAENIERRQTACAKFNLWPQAHLHTRWPGAGQMGDPIFDQYFASQVSQRSGQEAMELSIRNAGAALLDRIGPAILLTHSQSGQLGWLIGDARPELVKAILAIEPSGPPYFNNVEVGPPEYLQEGPLQRRYGITDTPIAYDPPIVDPSVDLAPAKAEPTGDISLTTGYLQNEPARKLVNLSRVPVLVVTGEASYHAAYDHCTVAYLRQAGVDVTHIALADNGIHGNAHMMMLEKNNDDIVHVMHAWLKRNEFAS